MLTPYSGPCQFQAEFFQMISAQSMHVTLMKQFPIQVQLAVALYQFGHNGNAASVGGVAQWGGISEGEVVKYTHRVIIAFLALHDITIQ